MGVFNKIPLLLERAHARFTLARISRKKLQGEPLAFWHRGKYDPKRPIPSILRFEYSICDLRLHIGGAMVQQKPYETDVVITRRTSQLVCLSLRQDPDLNFAGLFWHYLRQRNQSHKKFSIYVNYVPYEVTTFYQEDNRLCIFVRCPKTGYEKNQVSFAG